jgi:transposase
MSEIATVGLDLAKNVFPAHSADASGRAVLRKKLRRDKVLAFFGQLRPCVVAMCSIPDDHVDPRRSALFMARSILREVREGVGAC